MIFTKQIYNFEQIVVDITNIIYDVHKTNGIHYPFPFCCDREELIKKHIMPDLIRAFIDDLHEDCEFGYDWHITYQVDTSCNQIVLNFALIKNFEKSSYFNNKMRIDLSKYLINTTELDIKNIDIG